MYKKGLLHLLFVFSLASSKAQTVEIPASAALEEGGETYVFGDTLLVRSEPGTMASILDTLVAGTNVKILNKQKSRLSLKGFNAPWVFISYRKNGGEATGYVWSGLLALQPLRRADTKFIYGIDRAVPTDTLLFGEKKRVTTFQVKLKVIKDNQLIASERFAVDGESATFTEAKILRNGGLNGVESIIALAFTGEACGIPAYTHHFAWNGSTLIKLPTLTDISDAGVFYYTEQLVFPHDKGGKANQLVVKVEEGESTEKMDKNGDLIFSIKKKSRSYQWNGSELKPLKL